MKGRRSDLAEGWRLDSGVGFLIRLIDARYAALYEEITRQAEVTPRQFGVLIALYQGGTMTLTGLAARVHADRSTLGEMIKRMAARGLVSRKDNGRDGRSFEIALAPEGEAALLALVDDASRLQNAFLAPVPREERAAFLRNLKRVAFG